MKTFIKAAIIGLTISFTTIYAHGGHTHIQAVPLKKEIDLKTIKEIAKREVRKLSMNEKIDKSWLFVSIAKIKKVQYPHGEEWKISFENKKIEDVTKQTLYIFVNVYGEITGANYTGK